MRSRVRTPAGAPARVLLAVAEQLGDDLVGEAVALAKAPGARPCRSVAEPPPLEQTPGPVVLPLTGERVHDGGLDERLGQTPRSEVGGDFETSGAAGAERPRPVVRIGRVAHPAELAAARHGGVRGLAPVTQAHEPSREVRLGARRARQEAR